VWIVSPTSSVAQWKTSACATRVTFAVPMAPVSRKTNVASRVQLASIGLIVGVSVLRNSVQMRISHAPKYAKQGVNVMKAVTVTQMAFVWFVKECKLVATILNGTSVVAHVQQSVANRKPSSVRSNVCPNANVTKDSCSMPLAVASRKTSVTSRVQLESTGPIVAMSVQSSTVPEHLNQKTGFALKCARHVVNVTKALTVMKVALV